MVVILRGGTVNYAVQFPGERILGDYLPTAEGATAAFTAALHITAARLTSRRQLMAETAMTIESKEL